MTDFIREGMVDPAEAEAEAPTMTEKIIPAEPGYPGREIMAVTEPITRTLVEAEAEEPAPSVGPEQRVMEEMAEPEPCQQSPERSPIMLPVAADRHTTVDLSAAADPVSVATAGMRRLTEPRTPAPAGVVHGKGGQEMEDQVSLLSGTLRRVDEQYPAFPSFFICRIAVRKTWNRPVLVDEYR